jgi:hypothetical protein
MTRTEWVNKNGIIIQEEVEFEKREFMTRQEWRCYFALEEINEEEYKNEYAKYKRPLDS